MEWYWGTDMPPEGVYGHFSTCWMPGSGRGMGEWSPGLTMVVVDLETNALPVTGTMD